jgi:ABC-2 type transport system ATP-binding protein
LNSAITVRDLRKEFVIPVKQPGLAGAFRYFVDKKTKTVRAVDGISFSVDKGELVGFLGPNGAGKTTTLKMLSGLLHPTAGEIRVLGREPWRRERAFQMTFSMVMGQRTQLWWDLPARETFRLNQKIYEIPEADYVRREEELVELLDLRELVDTPVKKLSLGERMKAELACALLHRPQVLLLDEPTLGLDLVMQKKLRQFILDYNRRFQATILLTSHNMDDVEELCRRVMVIDDGKMLYDGDLDRIVHHYAPDKRVSLSCSKPLDAAALAPFGRVTRVDGNSAEIEIPRREVSRSLERLLAQFPVVDLSIEELPIEEIVRRVFLSAGAQNPPPLFSDGNPPASEKAREQERSAP